MIQEDKLSTVDKICHKFFYEYDKNDSDQHKQLCFNSKKFYGFIRETECPAVICEGGFVDNANDASQIDTDEECKAFGEAYARGILKTLGITPKQDTESTTTSKEDVFSCRSLDKRGRSNMAASLLL